METKARVSVFLFFSLLPLFAAPVVNAGDCDRSAQVADQFPEPMITIPLPVDSVYVGTLQPDTITIPNGRPIYALFVHGYTQNIGFDQLLCYSFAKRLMEDGAYVHYAWWNNLCEEYMGGALHHENANPGTLGLGGVWNGAVNPDAKALPVDDYQFQADAEAFLQAIRTNNPNAMIIVAGHSMGGAAVARLGSDTKVVIDILAPLDPVGNRSRPWYDYGASFYHNWTRYRIAHEDLVEGKPIPDPEQRRTFGTNVINLFHRYQMEYEFPMDHQYRVHFVHNIPPGGSSTQRSVATCASLSVNCYYPSECCASDGHGEIVGYRGLRDWVSFPLALEAQGDWPTGVEDDDKCRRRRLLIEMPYADFNDDWKHRPSNPDLCLVSEGLISLYESINRPPVADAGEDRTVAHTLSGVTLDGSASTDPDIDDLSYTWEGPNGEVDGRIITVPLEIGTHEITLTVRDPSGHIDRDTTEVTVVGGVNDEAQSVTRLIGAHPNPFNAATQVAFELAERHRVSLQIFDLKGRLVRTLEEGTFEPGRYGRAWNGRDDAGSTVASGTYFVRMRAGDRSEFSKILLLK